MLTETSHERDSGRNDLPCSSIPFFLPRKPRREFRKLLTASTTVRRRSDELASTNRVARIKSRPPWGIMLTLFRAVKQFLGLLFDFSPEFNRWSKWPKNTGKIALMNDTLEPPLLYQSRKKLSLLTSWIGRNTLVGHGQRNETYSIKTSASRAHPNSLPTSESATGRAAAQEHGADCYQQTTCGLRDSAGRQASAAGAKRVAEVRAPQVVVGLVNDAIAAAIGAAARRNILI